MSIKTRFERDERDGREGHEMFVTAMSSPDGRLYISAGVVRAWEPLEPEGVIISGDPDAAVFELSPVDQPTEGMDTNPDYRSLFDSNANQVCKMFNCAPLWDAIMGLASDDSSAVRCNATMDPNGNVRFEVE